MNNPKPIVGLMTQGPVGKENILMVIDGETYSVNRQTCPKFDEVIEAYNNKDYDLIPGLVSAREALSNFLSSTGETKVTFSDEHIMINGVGMPDAMEHILLGMYYAGTPMQPYVELCERLDNALSMTVKNELFGWMQAALLPISEKGTLFAYRAVEMYQGPDITSANGYPLTKGDLVDSQTSSWRNNVGDECKMKRAHVDDDRGNACAPGLHFASLSHALGFGGKTAAIVIVEVDPVDVVTIPTAHVHKGRCCRFKVVGIAKYPDSSLGVNKAALGTGPVATKAQIDTGSMRWILMDPEGFEIGRCPSRAKVIAARDDRNITDGPGYYWKDATK